MVLPVLQACAVLAPSDPANPPLGLRQIDGGYEIVVPLCAQDRAMKIFFQDEQKGDFEIQVGDTGVRSRVEDHIEFLSFPEDILKRVNKFTLHVSSDQRTWLMSFRAADIGSDINGGIDFDYQNVTLDQLRRYAEKSDC